MPARTRTKAKTRPAVSRHRIIRAAVMLADRGGLEAVTMRQIAKKLRVEAMSLYHHVADKEDIFDGMVDRVYSKIEIPADTDWRSAMRHRALSARRVLKGHCWAVGLLDSRTAPGPATLQHHDQVIGLLRRASFSISMATRAFSLLDSYIYGFVIQELSLPFDNSREMADVAGTILKGLPADAYPNLAELTRAHMDQTVYDAEESFTFGLDLILDGLARRKRQ